MMTALTGRVLAIFAVRAVFWTAAGSAAPIIATLPCSASATSTMDVCKQAWGRMAPIVSELEPELFPKPWPVGPGPVSIVDFLVGAGYTTRPRCVAAINTPEPELRDILREALDEAQD